MSDKKKRLLMIAGGGILALVLIVAIAGQFHKAPPAENVQPSSGATGSEATPELNVSVPDKTEKGATVRSDGAESSAPVDSTPPQTDQAVQKLQPDVSKPEAPEKPKVADGADTKNPVKPPEYKPEDTEKKPAESAPQGGEKKDGKVYLPGFGWVTETGGSGSTADDMYENGNKIGEMD